MTVAERYKTAAARLRVRAEGEGTHQIKKRLESLAQCYVLLAEQARASGAAETIQSRSKDETGKIFKEIIEIDKQVTLDSFKKRSLNVH